MNFLAETDPNFISQIFTIGDLSKDLLTCFLAWLVWRETAKLNELKRAIDDLKTAQLESNSYQKAILDFFLSKKTPLK